MLMVLAVAGSLLAACGDDGESSSTTTAAEEPSTTTRAVEQQPTSTVDRCTDATQNAINIIGIQLNGLQGQGPAAGLPEDASYEVLSDMGVDIDAACGVVGAGDAVSAILVYLKATSAVRPPETTGTVIDGMIGILCDSVGATTLDVVLTPEAEVVCTTR